VIARRPDHRGEAAPEQRQCSFDVVEEVADVAGHHEPVARRGRPELVDDPAVLGVRDVQIADGEEAAHRADLARAAGVPEPQCGNAAGRQDCRVLRRVDGPPEASALR
jgi:hypothetical protein